MLHCSSKSNLWQNFYFQEMNTQPTDAGVDSFHVQFICVPCQIIKQWKLEIDQYGVERYYNFWHISQSYAMESTGATKRFLKHVAVAHSPQPFHKCYTQVPLLKWTLTFGETVLVPLTCCEAHCVVPSMKADDLRKASNSCASDVRSLPFSMLLACFSALAPQWRACSLHTDSFYTVWVCRQLEEGRGRREGVENKAPIVVSAAGKGRATLAGASYVMGLAGPTSPFGLKPEKKRAAEETHTTTDGQGGQVWWLEI